MKYILAIDQGTSGTKAIIFDVQGKAVVRAAVPLQSYYPEPGWVEQSAEEIYINVLTSVENCLKEFERIGGETSQIISCGISNQRETFVIWDEYGEPLHPAIVWQCKRSVAICERLLDANYAEFIQTKSGLVIDPYFSGSKVIWLYENHPGVKKAIDGGKAYFGNVDTWLLYKLTGGRSYMTDYTNASRTMFFNLVDLSWDMEIMGEFGLSNLNLPEVKPSVYPFGDTSFDGFLPQRINISSMIGDSHAAAFGEGCFEIGSAKATLGTGCSVLMNVGQKPVISTNGMISTICWSTKDRIDYALEGVIVSAGATIEWVRRQLGLFNETSELEVICRAMEDNGGVYIIPAFSGMGAPYWDMSRKATIEGLTFASSKNHVIRAAVESVAYQIKDVITAMEQESNAKLSDLKIDGGISSNGFAMAFLADLLGQRISKIEIADASALGAAYLAGLGEGLYQDLEQLERLSCNLNSIIPENGVTKAKENYQVWKRYVNN